jgi:GTP1/Obg family GTP-binding protein
MVIKYLYNLNRKIGTPNISKVSISNKINGLKQDIQKYPINLPTNQIQVYTCENDRYC